MEANQKEAFKKVLPKYFKKFETKEKLSNQTVSKIKKEIKQELHNPNVSIYKKDMAKFVLIYLIEQGEIKNKEEFDAYCHKYGFIQNNLEKFELDTIADSYLIDDEEENFEENLLLYDHEYIRKHHLKDDPDWFVQIGLKEDPFPSQDGLYLIHREDYETVVLKTQIYNKYIENLEQYPKWILNKSIVIYGDFGCGKTTFFDYLDYKLILNDIQPIRIILNAKPSLPSLLQNFNESLFLELSSYISKYSTIDPRGNLDSINNYSILSLFERIQSDRKQKGFVIFLDGLHKSQDQRSTALNFLIELQNILEFFRRKKISLSIFIAGSLEWRDKINNSKKFSGSIFTLEKMDALSVAQSYEMLKRRFAAFSEIENKYVVKLNEIELLVTSIERTLATDVNFRIFIKYFLQNSFIFKNRIKIEPLIEEDVLNNIFDTIKNNRMLYNNLIQFKQEFQDDKSKLIRMLKVISTTYDMGHIFEDQKYYQKNSQSFDYLQKKGIVLENKKSKKNGKTAYSLNLIVHNTFKDVENKVKFRPTHYFELLFTKKPEPIKKEAKYIGILDMIKRYRENNPEIEEKIEKLVDLTRKDYFKLINKVESTANFNISENIVKEMKDIIEQVLLFLYELSGEPLQIKNQAQIFKIFRYTWLDNRVLTQLFNWIDSWNPNKNDKKENKLFLKLFIDAYEALIFKIGKHIVYNKILIVSSKYLNNDEKEELNSARAFFSEKKYKNSIEKCHDLIEKTLREFIFNMLFFKYGKIWEEMLPTNSRNYIHNIKSKEKKLYGSLLSISSNSLYFLTRSKYSEIINNDYLWKNCFSILFGEAYRSFVKETLDNLANLGHLDKHGRDEVEIAKISVLIQQDLVKSKEIIEKINKSYINLLDLNSMIITKSEIIPLFHPQEKRDKLQPIVCDNDDLNQVLDIIKEINESNEDVSGRFIQLSNINQVRDIFSLPYRKFIGAIVYLIKKNIIQVEDYYGSSIVVKVVEI